MPAMQQLTVHAREGLYFRRKGLPEEVLDELDQKYTFMFYENAACDKCEYRPERHLEDICGNCAAFKGGAKLLRELKIGDKRYIRTPLGDVKGLKTLLASHRIKPKFKTHFPDTEFKKPVKFIGKLRAHQPAAVKAIIKKKRGVLRAPPRSGKTVMFTAAVCEIGQKTLILASQRDWLVGFRETFIGSKTQKALTNMDPSRIGFAKTYKDFLKYDVCLVTVQTFYHEKGQKLLKKIANLFPVCGVDEIHTGAAPKYATVLASLNCRWKIGLSGTPNRKDGRYILMRNLIGPIIADIKVERLRPQVRLVRTQYTKNSKGHVPWTYMVSHLEKDPKRLKLIAQWAVKDVENGHMVMIPLARVMVIDTLVKAINRIAGRDIAFPFHGKVKKSDRDLYIERARKYKIKVLVGQGKLMSTGINIPRASCIYDVTLSSNKENAEQRVSRILTPYEGKPNPLLRIFLDNLPARRRCLSSEWWSCVRPVFKPVISEKDEVAFKSYLAERPGRIGEGRVEL